jgi:hypothetical protein
MMNKYIIDLTGIYIEDWDNTTILIECNGNVEAIPFDKEDIVQTIIDEEENEGDTRYRRLRSQQ